MVQQVVRDFKIIVAPVIKKIFYHFQKHLNFYNFYEKKYLHLLTRNMKSGKNEFFEKKRTQVEASRFKMKWSGLLYHFLLVL